MYYISCMKNNLNNSETLLTGSVDRMSRSKVDIETSDIFFNLGVNAANKYVEYCSQFDETYDPNEYQKYLLADATDFLGIVIREHLTPQDLVDDYNNRT